MNFGVIIIGDEILSGKRADKHLPKVIELLQARGMSYVLFAMALAQMAAGSIAMGMDTQESPTFVLAFTGLYVVAWLLSALLFHKAARARAAG